jgi:uncharacterized protein YidB (DUF937 family)
LAAAAGLVAVVIGAGVVMAQSDEDGTGVTFLDRVAEKLGIERDTLDQAIEDARSDEIDERVANGDLTQEQADRLKERLDDLPADAPFLGPGFGQGFDGEGFEFGGDGFGFTFKFGHGGPGVGFDSEAMAEFLGIDAAQLREELQAEGATLATVADAHGKSRDELIAHITSDAKARLDERVAEGDITQERADEILANLNERVEEMVDREFGEKPFLRRLKDGFGFAFPGLGMGLVSEELAEFLGIDEAQLREELEADGATLASVSEAHGKTRDELKAFLSEGITEKVNAVVEEGILTQERADEILSHFNEMLDAFIDGELPGFGGLFRGEFRFDGGPAPFGDEMFNEEFRDMFENDPEPNGTEESELTPTSQS